MQSVFLVQHLHTLPGDVEDVKTIGVYSSREAAEAAVRRLANQPGFRDAPALIDPLVDDTTDGFYVDEYQINHDHWDEGFVTTSQ